MNTRKQVLKDFEPMIEREIKYRNLEDRLVKLGLKRELDHNDFSIFFGEVCILNDTLDTVEGFRELKSIVADSEFLFGEVNVKYLLQYLSTN